MSETFPVSTELVIAASSAIAALLAAAFAYKSYQIAKKSTAMHEAEHFSKMTKISGYLENSYKEKNINKDQHLAAFCIKFSNKSESTDSISDIYMETHYINKSDRLSKIQVNCDAIIERYNDQEIATKLPIALPPRTTTMHWFTFKIPSVATQSKRIQKYVICASNGKDDKVTVESYILQEKYDEETCQET